MRLTAQQYDEAIENLRLAKTQLEPDGNCCAVCGDSGHMAFECGHNPLRAMMICAQIAKHSEQLHEWLHHLAGYEIHFGVQVGPASPLGNCAVCEKPLNNVSPGIGIYETNAGDITCCIPCGERHGWVEKARAR